MEIHERKAVSDELKKYDHLVEGFRLYRSNRMGKMEKVGIFV